MFFGFMPQTMGSNESKGQEYCPQLEGLSEEFPIPVGIDISYALLARNLPTKKSQVFVVRKKTNAIILIVPSISIRAS